MQAARLPAQPPQRVGRFAIIGPRMGRALARTLAACLLALAAVGAAGCGRAADEGADGRELTVFAAASLREVFEALRPDAVFSFAGSDELALQIREGAPADVYAAASPRYPQELFAEGLVEAPIVFATNRLVVVVPADNPAGIAAVADLLAADVRLVVGAEGVPVGDYTRRVLEALGLEAVLENVVSEEDDVKGVVTKVALGEADAGFVYATDVEPVEAEVAVVELPATAQPAVEYQLAIAVATEHRAAAEEFVARVLSAEGRAALAAAGFGLP